jgi:hypothetical protein
MQGLRNGIFHVEFQAHFQDSPRWACLAFAVMSRWSGAKLESGFFTVM